MEKTNSIQSCNVIDNKVSNGTDIKISNSNIKLNKKVSQYKVSNNRWDTKQLSMYSNCPNCYKNHLTTAKKRLRCPVI